MKKIQSIFIAFICLSSLSLISQEASYSLDSIYYFNEQGLSAKHIVLLKNEDGDEITSKVFSIDPDGSEVLEYENHYDYENGERKYLDINFCLNDFDTCFLLLVKEYTNIEKVYRKEGPPNSFNLYLAEYDASIVLGNVSFEITGFSSDSLAYNDNGKVSEVYEFVTSHPNQKSLSRKSQYFWNDNNLIDSICFYTGDLQLTSKAIFEHDENSNLMKRCFYDDSSQLISEYEYFYDSQLRFKRSKSSRVGVEDTTYYRHEYCENKRIKYWEIINPAGDQIDGNYIEEFYLDDLISLDSMATYHYEADIMQHKLIGTAKYFYPNMNSDSNNNCNQNIFVNNSNRWYVDNCGSNIDTGETSCFTSHHYFGNSITINSKEYKILMTENRNPIWPLAQYYREENKKVYALDFNSSGEEFLIYDFNLEQGDQLEIGDGFHTKIIEVLSIDSIELNSGAKRKRMEIGLVSNNFFKTYWIEGIGSELSPLDTRYMLTYDAWMELNCYFIDDESEYSLKDCELTTKLKEPLSKVELTVFPNPCFDGKLIFQSSRADEVEMLEIYNNNGKRVLVNNEISTNEIEIDNFIDGIYFLRIVYKNNEYEFTKFIKS